MTSEQPKLRPMANLFAVFDRDAGFLDEMEEQLRRSGEFAEVWRPVPGWVVADSPLPDCVLDSSQIRERGFVFVEGRDRLETGDGFEWLDRVARLTDERPHALAELPGDFTYLRFRADGSATAVRACAGVAPLYLFRDGERVAVGTRLTFFHHFLESRFRPDPLVTALFAKAPIFLDGRTFVDGISFLPRGSYTSLEAGGVQRTSSYWDPRPPADVRLEPNPEHAERLRSLLLESLRRDLDPAGRNLLTLSGGIDSGSLAALAVGVVGSSISSLSFVPRADPDRSRILSSIEPLVERYGIEPAITTDLSGENRLRWLTEFPARPFPVSHPALCELGRVAEGHDVRVLFGGEFGDDVCGDWMRLSDWARYTSPAALLGSRESLPYGERRSVLRWGRRRLLDLIGRPRLGLPPRLEPWVHPDLQAEYQAWRGETIRHRARNLRPLGELQDRVALDAWVPMNWEATTELGIRRSIPFFTREMLELAFECHPSELFDTGRRGLARRALAEDVPRRTLFMDDRGTWPDDASDLAIPLPPDLPDWIEPMVAPEWLETPRPEATYGNAATLVRLLEVGSFLTRAAGGLQRADRSAKVRP
jgi:asparagine synthetase B (glutamine-hydrolysing)